MPLGRACGSLAMTGASRGGDRAAIDLQSAEYRQSLGSLLAATGQVSAAVMAAPEGIGTEPALGPALDDQGLQQTVAGWVRDGVSAKERRAWRASALAREHLRVIDLALTTEGFTPRPLDAVLADLPQRAAEFASAMIEEAETVLHPLIEGVGRVG